MTTALIMVFAITAVTSALVFVFKHFTTLHHDALIRISEIAMEQQEFIKENIQEKVIYATPDMPHVTEDKNEPDFMPAEDETEEMTAEVLHENKIRKG
jgi:hypothetical protein